MSVIHVITGLERGGTEAVLYRLVTASRSDPPQTVVSLGGLGFYGPRLIEAGVTVRALNITSPLGAVRGLFRLVEIMKECSPRVVQTWMYHANLIGGLAARIADIPRIIWGIHNANLEWKYNSLQTWIVGRVCGLLSSWVPHAVVAVSTEAKRAHEIVGYDQGRFVVIGNGCDSTQFRPNGPVAEFSSLKAFGRLVGMVARWDAYKDHRTFVAAADQVRRRHEDVGFVLCGSGINRGNAALLRLFESRPGLLERFELLDAVSDVAALLRRLRLHVLASSGEAFGLAVAEAMACGVPCIVTDVGCLRSLVGGSGWVVPAGDESALSDAITAGLAEDDEAHGRRAMSARKIAVERFSLDSMVESYRALWRVH